MTTAKSKLKKLSETPEGRAADRTWQKINQKLNYDGRWSVLGHIEGQSRMAKLYPSELEYLGRLQGWDTEYYGGVDWDAVPTSFLAACMELPDKRQFNTLCAVFPAPDRKRVIDASEQDPDHSNYEDFLGGDITFDELQERYPEATLLQDNNKGRK